MSLPNHHSNKTWIRRQDFDCSTVSVCCCGNRTQVDTKTKVCLNESAQVDYLSFTFASVCTI